MADAVRMEHAVVIARPPGEVFRYLTDVEKLPEWQSSAVDVRVDGPMRVGARVTETRTLVGRRAVSTLEVTEYEPDRKFSLRTVSGPIRFEVSHTLTPEDGGTRLGWVAEADTRGFPRLAVRMFAGTAERQFRGDFERLKVVLEGGADA
jgi:uncharacterized protein YndB with AHSA1/START domain